MDNLAYRRQVATASGLDALAGFLLLISPWIVGFSSVESATTNNVIFGILVGILASIRAFGAYEASWMSWCNAVLGLWVLISPWALGFSNVEHAMWNNVILGLAIIILACWSALATDANRPVARAEYRDRDEDRFGPPTI